MSARASESRTDADPTLVKAMAVIRDLRRKVESFERAQHEPLAVVGIGCRMPGGADSPAALWRLLVDGVDAVTEIPADRWDTDSYYAAEPDTAGRMTARHGAFVDGVDEFDPYFFGISPREAARMDPQQRIFLEVAWDAIEDAGMTRNQLHGSRTGVFVGANSSDYLQLQLRDPYEVDTYTSSGGANSLIPNRLSYLFDLRGPSLTVDSACSSSLVAVHLAGQSLRQRECDTAVVGGLNIILSPTTMMSFDRLGALSPDGRCKTFDTTANGYVRGEGVGVVVLKRLGDAIRDSDRIWATILGTAVNQDGLTNGLTAPNGLSQQEVITTALHNARLKPDQVTLLEAHGTGTPLGDPIEVESLNAVYGGDGATCALGSIKTNIGHLEAGAGIAGLIKTALSIHHRRVPPSLHMHALNEHIDLTGSRISIPGAVRDWDVPDEQRHGAVSAFGAGGTNAHVILGPAPTVDVPAAEPGTHVIPITARTEDALTGMLTRYRDFLAGQRELRDIAHCATVRRTQHEHRAVVVADTPDQAVDRLTAWLAGDSARGVATGRTSHAIAPGRVFVCAGHGTQRLGMGAELMRRCTIFRDAMTECDQALHKWLGRSVLAEIHRADIDELPTQLDIIQPALFSISVSLAARWRAWGVEPDMLVGHSMGEVAAAHIAGALSLDDAARVISLRSTLLERLRGAGTLLVVGLPMAEADELAAPCAGRVSVAVSNSTTSTVLSGNEDALTELAAALRDRNVFCRQINAAVAGHGPQVEPLREELLSGLAGITPQLPRVPVVSTVTGRRCDDFSAEYWWTNLRRPVLFWDAVRSLVEQDNGIFVELSPHPLLLSAVEQALDLSGKDGLALPSMRRDEPEGHAMAESLGALHANGFPTPLTQIPAGEVRAVGLPGYAWQRQPLWYQPRAGATPVVTETSQPPATVFELVRDTVAGVLHLDPARVDPHAGFFHLGMDSLLAAQVRRKLEAALHRKLRTPVMFEHPTVSALADHLAGAEIAVPVSAPIPVRQPETPQPDVDELSEDELLALLADEVRTSTNVSGSA